MLLAIDIGNTNISLGIFSGARIIKRYVVATRNSKLSAELKRMIRRHKVDNTIICSVVPYATAIVSGILTKLTGKRPYIIGKDILVPVKNLYRRPKQVGQDRLVNAYAGCVMYGAPLVAIDFGTAVTFDVVSKDKEYLGGMILPGLGISLDALSQRTALLPKLKLSSPKEFIGRDTSSSILSGIVYGFAAMTDDLIARIKEKIGRRALIIGTGGNINLIAKYCKALDKIDRDLTLKGLELLFRRK